MSTVYAIGIDFGTSNSCVTYATYYEDMNGRLEGTPVHRPEALTFQHKDTIATVVFLGDGADQQPLCGEMAGATRSCSRSSFWPICAPAWPISCRWTSRPRTSASRRSSATRSNGVSISA